MVGDYEVEKVEGRGRRGKVFGGVWGVIGVRFLNVVIVVGGLIAVLGMVV